MLMIEHRILGIHQFCCNFCCWGVECKIFELLYSLPVTIVIEICTLVRQSKQCKCIFPAKISYLTFFQGKFFRVFAGVCQINLLINGFNSFSLFSLINFYLDPFLYFLHPFLTEDIPEHNCPILIKPLNISFCDIHGYYCTELSVLNAL